MAKIDIPNINSQFASQQGLNARFKQIEDELNNKVLYRDPDSGEPNQMEAELDMNTNQIINLPYPAEPTSPVRIMDLEDIYGTGPGSGTQDIRQTQVIPLADGQLEVVFLIPISAGDLYINGPQVDAGRLGLDSDYTVLGQAVTLLDSYPAGTLLTFITTGII